MAHMVQKRDNQELDIIELLLREENHVRGIAKKLNEPHSTISRKLNNLKKQNVIDSRKEGKNKIFFLKQNIITNSYILQAELHKLTKLLHINPELIVIFEEILKKTDEKLVVLFGSYYKGKPHKDSDIDIAIISDDFKKKDIWHRAPLTHDAEIAVIRKFNIAVDLIKLTVDEYENETRMIASYVKEGKVVYSSN
mgnify:CR=1 FL=1